MDTSKMSLVDPAWEYLDPTPDIFAMFQEFDKTFFGGTMNRVELKWSKRMTSCAGLMAPLEGKGGACSIRLSEPLLKLRPRSDLVQTLLHEMIHAHLHVTKCRESDPHGPKFKEHMHRINKIAGTKITIYHNFHDEVNLHKQHWWRCSGPCRNWKPYFGWVKRATNRAPSKNDFWWAQHQQTCGGQYIKVKEPEGYSQNKLQKSKNGKLLSMIKKKYNLNQPLSTVSTPKITDLWKKKQTNMNSPKTPLKTNNTLPHFHKKISPNNEKTPSIIVSSKGSALGTTSNPYSMNNILGQLHKERLKRREGLLGVKKDHSAIKNSTDTNHKESKPIYVDLTESLPLSTSSKSKLHSSILTNSQNSSPKQISENSEQILNSKILQSSISDFSKPFKDKDRKESKRSFLSNKVDFIEKNIKLSSELDHKTEKLDFSSSLVSSPRKKPLPDSNPTSISSFQDKQSRLRTSTNSCSDTSIKTTSPQTDNKSSSILTEKDTAASLLLLKKKRKRLLSLNDSLSPTEQIKSKKTLKTTNSNLSSFLNPDFFHSSSYNHKKPFLTPNSSKEKNSLKDSLLSYNLEKSLSDSSSFDFSGSRNQETSPRINDLNTPPSSLHKERKLSNNNDSSSSPSPNNNEEKYSNINSISLSTPLSKERQQFTNKNSSYEKSGVDIASKRHWLTDDNFSSSPSKQQKKSLTKSNSVFNHFSSSTPNQKDSVTKLNSYFYSDQKKNAKLSSIASSCSTDQILSSTLDASKAEKEKKSKLFAQLFGNDSDCEIEPNETKTSKRSTTKSSFRTLTSAQIQSNRLENYFSTPIKNSSPPSSPEEEDLILIDNDSTCSDSITQSQTSSHSVACPICQKKVPEITINDHLDECLNMNFISKS